MDAKLLTYPHPFRAMLAICSDLDETPDRNVYLDIAKYLNTDQTTIMGPGVNLEVGNTIYFDMPTDQYSYRGTDDAGREMAHALIHSGHIDCIHSYGDFATTREHAKRALDDLSSHNCKIEVWVDHSKAPSNVGPDIMVGSGDLPEADVYHTDLTLEYGIRYIWRGRTTVVTAQNTPVGFGSLASIWNPRHPIASAGTVLKESVKIHLGRKGHPRWEMYAANDVLRQSTLRDGNEIWEFLRSHPHWGGAAIGADASGIGEVLTPRILNRLVRRQGVCIWYTHLGKVIDPACPFDARGQAGFRRLAQYRDEGQILVTTTHRLLRYLTARDHLKYRISEQGGLVTIVLESVDDPISGKRGPDKNDVRGLTFELPRCGDVEIRDADGKVLPSDRFEVDGRTIVSVRWDPLVFPQL